MRAIYELNAQEIDAVSGAGDGDALVNIGLFVAGVGAGAANPGVFTVGMAIATAGAGINLVEYMSENHHFNP